MKPSSLNMYVGEWGQYVIPDDVVSEAQALSPGKKLSDRRTRAGKYIERWGMEMDAREAINGGS